MWYKTCGWSVRCIRNLPVGENQWDNINDKIQIFPNPAADQLFIECGDLQNVEILIYNGTGQILLQRKLTYNASDLDIASLPKGIYMLRVITSQGNGSKKFIKE